MRKILYALLLILATLAIANACYFYKLPQECFLKYFLVPFSDLLQIAIAGIVLYLYVEYKNDIRSKRGFVKSICERIIKHASDSKIYVINSEKEIYHLRIVQRTMKNEINILKDFSKEFGYEEEIKYCEERLDEYWDFVSDYITDTEELKKRENKLENFMGNLINKLEFIIAKMYRKSW